MYEKIFDQKSQIEMDKFFLEMFSKEGNIKWYEKGVILDPTEHDQICLIIEGELNQVMFSKTGDMINYYRLLKGNIFGEIDYFDTDSTHVVNKVIKTTKLAVISRDIVEKKLIEHPEMYKYFLSSIVKKYRIIMLELANYKFNDADGKLADFLLRIYYSEENPRDNEVLDILFTQEEVANRIGVNRITVTKSIKRFKELDLIQIVNRKVIIKDVEGLKKYTNIPI